MSDKGLAAALIALVAMALALDALYAAIYFAGENAALRAVIAHEKTPPERSGGVCLEQPPD